MKVMAVIAVVGDARGRVECELREHADTQLADIPIGARVSLNGKLRRWTRGERGVVAIMDDCWVSPD